METSPENYQLIKSNGFRLFCHWHLVTLREQEPTSQCRRCQRFGHKSHQCRYEHNGQPASRCYRCGGCHEGECTQEPNCANCSEFNDTINRRGGTGGPKLNCKHIATDTKCPSREKAFRQAKLRIDYGGEPWCLPLTLH